MKILSSFQNRIKNWFGSSKNNDEFEIQFTNQTPENIIRSKININNQIIEELDYHGIRIEYWFTCFRGEILTVNDLAEPAKSFVLNKLYPFSTLESYINENFPEAQGLDLGEYCTNLTAYQLRWYNHLISELEQENEVLLKALEILERK